MKDTLDSRKNWPGPGETLTVAFAALLTGLVATTTESLWIDEFASLVVADHRTIDGLLGALTASSQSDGQMPLYMIWLWAWIRLFGTSEWAIRAANIPWLVVGVLGLARWNKYGKISSTPILVLLACLSPFLWFYTNEARPYIMQFAGASLFLGGVVASAVVSERGTPSRLESADCWALAVGAVILCGSSLLGVPWFLAGLLVLTVSWRTGSVEIDRRCLALVLITGVVLLVLAAYYVGTLMRGAAPYVRESSFIMTLGFSLYELLGFVGLGPSRLDLRLFGSPALAPFASVLIGAATIWALAAGVATSLCWRRRRPDLRLALTIFALVSLPLIFLAVLSEWRAFRVLGRHLTPLLPLLLLALGGFISALVSSARTWHSGLAASAVLVCALSAVSWRLSERHRKDDYRLAAAVASEALLDGKTVWWAANSFGAVYYGLPLDPADGLEDGVVQSRGSPALLGLANPRPEALDGLDPPDVLILSKPDLFDRDGALSAIATAPGYRESLVAPAFTVYYRDVTQ